MNKDQIELDINAATLSVMALFAAKQDIRYYLCGIHIRPCENGEGVTIEATNGHQAAIWLDKTGKVSAPTILSMSKGLVAAAGKTPKKNDPCHERRLRMLNDRLVLFFGDEEVFIQPENPIIDGKFPCFENVIPEAGRFIQEQNHINHRYLATITKAADQILKLKRIIEIHGGDWAIPIKTRSSQNKRVSVTRLAGVDDLIILTMPIEPYKQNMIIDSADPIGEDHRAAYPKITKEATNDQHSSEAA